MWKTFCARAETFMRPTCSAVLMMMTPNILVREKKWKLHAFSWIVSSCHSQSYHLKIPSRLSETVANLIVTAGVKSSRNLTPTHHTLCPPFPIFIDDNQARVRIGGTWRPKKGKNSLAKGSAWKMYGKFEFSRAAISLEFPFYSRWLCFSFLGRPLIDDCFCKRHDMTRIKAFSQFFEWKVTTPHRESSSPLPPVMMINSWKCLFIFTSQQ